MPESAAYRKYTEEIVKRRLALVEQVWLFPLNNFTDKVLFEF